MGIYLKAVQRPGMYAGRYVGGPWRIVWHTTETGTAEEAMGLFAKKYSWPHFTVDADVVYQHYDTNVAARSLEHPTGTPETNNWHAVQIELVAHAAQVKPPELLARAARLARWIERTHAVPQLWPAGYPLGAVDGKDPKGHNRSPDIWRLQGGHYGHSQVPNNSHWDPGLIDIPALMAPDPIVPEWGDFPATGRGSRPA
jgi:hypothetical protein